MKIEEEMDLINKKVIAPMYSDGEFPLALAVEVEKALEKQIPKPVDITDTEKYTYYSCPVCHNDVSFNQIYCDECGQRLGEYD